MTLVTPTGKVGSVASPLPARRGVPVRLLALHALQTAALAEAGVNVVEGNLDIPENICFEQYVIDSAAAFS